MLREFAAPLLNRGVVLLRPFLLHILVTYVSITIAAGGMGHTDSVGQVWIFLPLLVADDYIFTACKKKQDQLKGNGALVISSLLF